MCAKIQDVDALEILDSRGNPTILTRIVTDTGIVAKASVPSGASTGENEAVELRDGDPRRYQGKGVLKALQSITGPIRDRLIGVSVDNQERVDRLMIELDGTENKSRLGANAILGVSLACARAAAQVKNIPLYASIGKGKVLPVPMMNIMNGGAHADNSLEFQEFMIRPVGFKTFAESLRAGVEIFHTLKNKLRKKHLTTSVGDEGGFAPNVESHEEALDLIMGAITLAGFKPGRDIMLALDCAASELFDQKTKCYIEKKKQRSETNFGSRTSSEQIAYLAKLVQAYPIDSIEDGLSEHDWEGWKELTQKLGDKVQIVGDDIFVTNISFLERGIREKIANAILIKVNQIGTLTETLAAIALAQKNGYKTIISHRSGETEDSFIADLAVASSSGQIKTGAPSRSDRVAKYNRLLEIEQELLKK